MRLVTAAVAFLLLLTGPAEAQNIGFAVRAGTTGIGGEVGVGLTRKLNVRGHFSTFTYGYTDTTTGEDPNLSLEADAGIGAMSAFLDLHPFGNSFRLTAGAGKNNFDVSATGRALDPVCFGDETQNGGCDGKEFSPDKLGALDGNVSYPSSIHPYMGIGFGSLGNGESLVTFLFDLGVFYTGAPEIDLENNGLFRPTTEPENLQVLNDGFESFKWYPVLSIGIGFRI